ncbi:hypothetical protein BGW37DRAFT_493616 [Umbelopsis sp. PMI_123]|nr:hypothetical protein BGW37DRAFT_493616 [Umbelopsis sp. PMI_123]
MATTYIDYFRDTNVLNSNDGRRISQQSIPSLSTTSTDTSTSIDTSRPKSAGSPKVNRRRTRSPSPSGGGYLYQTNDFQPWSIYQQQHRGCYSPFYPQMYGIAPQPLINFPDPTLPPMHYKHTPSPKSKKCYKYEPILPVPLAAVTMEATSMSEGYDYDDNIPLAYFKRMSSSSVTNKPHTTKKVGTSPVLSSNNSIPTLSTSADLRHSSTSRSRTHNDMNQEKIMKRLARSSTATQQNQSSNPVRTEKIPKKQRLKPSHSSSSPKPKDIQASPKTSDSGSNSSISSPNWVSRFQAGMARIRLKSVKNKYM